MRFTIEFDMDGAAFADAPLDAVAGVLRDVAHRVSGGDAAGGVRDANGNTIGEFTVTTAPREALR